MLHNNHESFLSELSKTFESGRQTNRSIWITMKRYDGRTKRNPRKPNDKPKKSAIKKATIEQQSVAPATTIPDEYKCLIRARIGDKKMSAVIARKDLSKFQQSYSNLIKGNIYGLKKKTTATQITMAPASGRTGATTTTSGDTTAK